MSYKAANETYFEQAREIPCSFNFGIAFSYSLIWLYSLGIKIPSYGFLLLHHRRAFCHCPFFMDRCTPKGAFDKLSHNSPSVLGIVFFDACRIIYVI
ncbi:unknown [Ruminococcus sp. CAG:382]|nr:unknown [Ruminococcus sp. CAG:382]